MPAEAPSYVYGEDIAPRLIVKKDPANDHQVLKATLGDRAIGVSHEGSREAPIPSVTPLAAKQGESAQVYVEEWTAEVDVGTLAIAAGDRVAPDANSKAQPAVHGFPFVGEAEAAAAASGRARIVVRQGVHDNRQQVVVKADTTYTVPLKELGATLTNTGATGATTFALPAALPGYEIFARVTAAQQLRLDPNGTETIALPSTGVQAAAGKYIWADAATESVHLKCNIAGQWDVLGFTGTWTAEV